MQAALQETVNAQKAILEPSKKPDKKLTLVDNRGLAKPSNFDGNSDFLQWKIRLEAFVESVHGDFGQAMAWAEDETDPNPRRPSLVRLLRNRRQYQTWNQKMHTLRCSPNPLRERGIHAREKRR